MISKTISYYKILEKLGSGGMGVVYKARDTKLDRFVALKFLPSHLSQSPEDKKRFIHEAKAASALQHNNICTIHEINKTEDGQMYIVMDCYEGESLKERISRGPLPVKEAVEIAVQIARGLEKAHAKGIVHRDIKPANILLTEDGTVKIVDFGLAKLADRSLMTKEGTTLGTAAYMSPEQTRGDAVDQRADIWAMGVILYEMLGGERPFRGEYEQAIIYSILNETPTPLRKVNPSVPAGLERVVHQALARKPDDRYQTMADMRKDLEAVADGRETVSAEHVRRSGSRRNTAFLIGALGLVTILIALQAAGVLHWLPGGSSGSGYVIRIAVLPFANLSGDTGQDYFSDGITEEMINELGRLHPAGLNVIGRTSVLQYKGGDIPVDQIGRDLGVEYVLEGSTKREADLVRISAKLIRVKDQTQLWGESFDRELSGILVLQSEVARRVAETLALKLLPGERLKLTNVRIVDPEVHDLYLKGFQHWKRLTRNDLDIAMRYFQTALEKDSAYAPLYEGMAFVWAGYQQMGYMSMSEVGSKSTACALKAISLDEYSAEAHFALAGTRSWIEWQWEAAAPSWERAMKLNPSDATAQSYYGHYLAIMGKTGEALRHSERAVALDPFNPSVHAMQAGVLNFMKRYSDAETAARKALDLQPDLPIGWSQLSLALEAQGKYEESLNMLRKNYADDAELTAALERGYAEAGYQGSQRRLADLLADRYKKSGGIRAQGIGEKYYVAGDYERALDWFEISYGNHEGNLPYISRPFFYDTLGSDPRYLELLRRMGVPAER